MKRFLLIIVLILPVLVVSVFLLRQKSEKRGTSAVSDAMSYCLTGAFLADRPSVDDIRRFERDYGKKPYLVMVFTDWDRFVEDKTIDAIYSAGCVPFITWEPWRAAEKQPIDYEGLLNGDYDSYIKEFASRLRDTGKPVFLRFAHEMNGNWYPWAGASIGAKKYIALYKYVKDLFDKEGADNVKWVFSVNWQDVPSGGNNRFMRYYPGDKYVDYVGVDGYNWGDTQQWSRWMNFKEIFGKIYGEIVSGTGKPVIISEFSSTSSGGDKALWIKEAMTDIRSRKSIKAFVLFNVDKETDWSFSPGSDPGKEIIRQLEDDHFKDNMPVSGG